MLRLNISGEPVDLSPTLTINLDEESPVFSPNSIPGGFSFPFTLPATPRNRRILGHPSRIETKTQGGLDLPFELLSNGRLFGTGTATIQKTTTQDFSVFLQVATGDFAGKIEGKKLSDVDFGGVRPWVFKAEYKAPEDDFALFPVYNPNFMDGTEFEAGWTANNFRLNSYSAGHFDNVLHSVMAITPFPYLGYVVNRIFDYFGFPVQESIINTDPDLKALVIYNPRDAAQYSTNVTQVAKTYPGVYETDPFNGDYILDLNGQRILKVFQVKVSTITRQFDTWDLKDTLPDMLISDFILSVRTMFNLAFIINGRGSVIIRKRKDLVLSTEVTPLDKKIIGEPQVTVEPKVTGVYLRYTHDENDMIFTDEFKDIYANEKLLRPSVNTIADLQSIDATINEIRLVRSYAQYYQYAGTEVDGVTSYEWKFYSNDFQDFKQGEKPEEYTSLTSTLPMIHYQRTIGGPYIRIPRAKQLSSSDLREEPVPFGLRFLFYRGMVTDSTGALYPYGSSDPYDSGGVLLPGAPLSLRWDGPTGLYEQLWKDYLTWWDTRKSVTWMVTNPSELDFFTVYAIQHSHYLLKKRSLSIDTQGPQPGECEFYQV